MLKWFRRKRNSIVRHEETIDCFIFTIEAEVELDRVESFHNHCEILAKFAEAVILDDNNPYAEGIAEDMFEIPLTYEYRYKEVRVKVRSEDAADKRESKADYT